MPSDSKSNVVPDIEKLLQIMTQLRDSDTGCDWDKQQTFNSIVPHTLEEAHEVADAIERDDFVHLKEELGDLLFQVIFYAQLGKEQGLFDFADIVQTLNEKLVRRHPHVFAKKEKLTDAELEEQWHKIKQQEKSRRPTDEFAADIPSSLPALTKAYKTQKRAAKLGFDWPSYHGAWDKVQEEIAEVNEALQVDPLSEHTAEEIGDLLFATVNVSRHIKRDPEQLLRQANEKFKHRFVQIESVLNESSLTLEEANLAQMDAAWETVKRRQRGCK
ncbi:nucleoside triphosphate pyrophosphohydrolase [Pseudoalteromonas sp. McH1-7]|uniref:nucleoside triphosphate pyrophosphohydrolase n=1 Tax=Pseudoalteromonas TaxID=53246 RepID=UPI000FFEE3BD|nr:MULTISPECIES: nucleoside triphosphate pyrophosphohydrolase [Pseudoalteromonas]MDW7550104.1 nucleoside triphosphate pyrophosphohydrolase [Pseudoalteromonas peptidolytica]NUZ09650.1 nucleoside triphosphate pyrophosphohydrolase [Pseudoalteromonas sp. McH1-7]RXE97501.1 nucleoside triphosphate pyrophosphohydrolase [Pseudoalteromonas sp. PS5]USD29561.1 nucleoside triphosphate pyrophosphohydrolase [Pseudoalteromonas sp. SCSIO 43201]